MCSCKFQSPDKVQVSSRLPVEAAQPSPAVVPTHRTKSIYKVILVMTVNYFLERFLTLLHLFMIENELHCSVSNKSHDAPGKQEILPRRRLSSCRLCSV